MKRAKKQSSARRGTHAVASGRARAKRETPQTPATRVKVIGVGGGGGNIVSRMSKDFTRGIEFIAVNTDHQDLDHAGVKRKIYIGRNLTKGMGTGMNSELGRQAAEENRSEIASALEGTDLVFIAAGLGGGTGTGGSPVVAEVAKQMGALTIAFVTKPFSFEGSHRERVAGEGLARLRDRVDAIITVSNDKIFTVIESDTPIIKAFEAIDGVLKNALQGIVDLIVIPGIINVDFADVRAIVQDSGSAIIGMGTSQGEERALDAMKQAMGSPLIEITPDGAKGVILGISGRDLTMSEINEAARFAAQSADPGAKVIFGAYYDRKVPQRKIRITYVATNLDGVHQAPSLFAQRALDRRLAGGGEKEGTEEALKPEETPSSTRQGERGKKIEADDFETRARSKKQPPAVAEEDKRGDIWDIPTFLRKRRKH